MQSSTSMLSRIGVQERADDNITCAISPSLLLGPQLLPEGQLTQTFSPTLWDRQSSIVQHIGSSPTTNNSFLLVCIRNGANASVSKFY